MFDLEGDDDEDDDDNDEEDDDSDTNEKCIQKTHMAGHINKAISSSSSQSVDNNCICFICKEDLPKRRNKKQSNDDFLQCEECGRCMHLRCLFQDSDERRQVKDLSEREDWFCVDCNPRPVIGTAWIPLGDVDIDSGVLAVLLESQNLPGMKQKSSAKKNKNELPMSWFSKSKGLTWKTTDYQAGDIVLFDSLLVSLSICHRFIFVCK